MCHVHTHTHTPEKENRRWGREGGLAGENEGTSRRESNSAHKRGVCMNSSDDDNDGNDVDADCSVCT